MGGKVVVVEVVGHLHRDTKADLLDAIQRRVHSLDGKILLRHACGTFLHHGMSVKVATAMRLLLLLVQQYSHLGCYQENAVWNTCCLNRNDAQGRSRENVGVVSCRLTLLSIMMKAISGVNTCLVQGCRCGLHAPHHQKVSHLQIHMSSWSIHTLAQQCTRPDINIEIEFKHLSIKAIVNLGGWVAQGKDQRHLVVRGHGCHNLTRNQIKQDF